MKFYKYLMVPALFAALLSVSGCEEENEESKAILPGETEIIMPAAESTKAITIYADGAWYADVTDDWLNIDPTSGFGTMDINLMTAENVSNTARSAKIIVKGSTKLGDIEINITQKMDRFRGTSSKSVTEALALEEGDLAKLSECQVVALTTEGFIVSDGNNCIYVIGKYDNMKVGDKLTLTGDVVEFNGITAINLEDPFYVADGTVSYPEAKDITEVSEYAPGKIEYVKVTASYKGGGKMYIGDDVFATAYKSLDDFSSLEYHKVALTGYYLGENDGIHVILPLAMEDIATEAIAYLSFEIETSAFKSANPDFGKTYKFNDLTGNGYIQYVPYDLANTDAKSNFEMDISGDDPRCTGPWPGDYWLFCGNSPIKAGSEVQIKFGARTSATGHKYWIIEYLDGAVWKIAGTPLESTDIPEGNNVIYTHAMNADGSTNVTIDETVVFTKNVDKGQFRFRCVTNWQANGKGALETRNGGSARLAVESAKHVAPQPSVMILKVGDGQETVDPEPIYANIEMSSSLLTFEGAPEAPKTVTITSDHDFSIKSTAEWLHLDVTEGVADTPTKITVTCDPSTLATLRQDKIIITSEDSRAEINVVQSAAGGELDPLISLSRNNVTVLGEGETISVNVQANVGYEVDIQDDWLSEVAAPATKAIVEKHTHGFVAAPNRTGAARTGHIRFYNENKGIESVLTIQQDNFEPRVTITLGRNVNGVSGGATSLKYHIDANIPYNVTTSASWIKFPATNGIAGIYDVPVSFEANPTSSERTGTVTFSNDTYGYSIELSVKQHPAGIVFAEDFEWLDPWSEVGKAGRTVEDNDLDAAAPQLPTYKIDDVSALQALLARGYEFTRWNKGNVTTSECIYLQRNYIKVGKTGYHAAIQLPAMSSASDAVLYFDWCPMRQGSGKVDPVHLIVVVENGSDSRTIEIPTHGWENNHVLEWIHASADLSGITIDENTRIIIRQIDEENAAGTANRWFIDNIRVAFE